MENNVEKDVKATIVPWLLGICGALITTFGTMMINKLENITDKMDQAIVQNAQQQKDIETNREQGSEIKIFYQAIMRDFAKHEDLFHVRPPKHEN